MEHYYVFYSNGYYYWHLKAPNGKIILASESYSTKSGAETGINSCKVNSPYERNYDRRVSKNNQYYFVLKAQNGEIIGTSEMYPTTQARDHGILACMRYGPTARTVYA